MKNKTNYLALLLTMTLLAGCTSTTEDVSSTNGVTNEVVTNEITTVTTNENSNTANTNGVSNNDEATTTTTVTTVVEEPVKKEEPSNKSEEDLFAGYKLIEVDACNLSGHREPNVVVNIGAGNRQYFAFTNEYGQLVKVIADEITLQDDRTEQVTSSGRYCRDEAKVPGVESSILDEGHIIADSAGGVSNAYNITPQYSVLNRHGDQAYMERVIREAGGATNFEAIITYPDTKTQVPSHYQYTYTVKGNTVTDSYPNGNPDEINESLGLTSSKPSASTSTSNNSTNTPNSNNSNNSTQEGDISNIDTNGDGLVSIKEAKAAGFKMPIDKSMWIYQYMRDADGDGYVGE